MSNNEESGSARDYVESYVKKTNESAQDYLIKEQPKFDPSKPVQSPQTTPIEKEKTPEPIQPSDHYKAHLPTHNPISSSYSDSEKNSNKDSKSNVNGMTKEQIERAQAAHAARDFKEQRSEIHEAAQMVCADLHEKLFTCFQHGSWWDKAKMCEEQKQKFWTCYHAQKKFMKEVNYKGPVNTEKEDARILVEAYKLRDKLDEMAE